MAPLTRSMGGRPTVRWKSEAPRLVIRRRKRSILGAMTGRFRAHAFFPSGAPPGRSASKSSFFEAAR